MPATSSFIPAPYCLRLSPWQCALKRLFDIVGALLCLLVFAVPMLVCYILIKREDGGSAIYRQERIGRNGMPFYILKFRSMHADSEREGPQLSEEGLDMRSTRIGHRLRASHLDELPQFWNVLRGDMSFVGPRPERRYFINLIREQDPRIDYIFQVRPGLSSFATLLNGYTHTTEQMLRRLRYDLFYISHASLGTDLLIVWLTARHFLAAFFAGRTK
ncbi:MAG: sugar transferase [Alloprevotella sp.]|nr:sugar transferase [Alloprevotella sp.]